MQDIAHTINVEAEHAKRVLLAIRDEADGDEQLTADTVEGSTNLLEAIDAGLERLGQIDALQIGLKAHIEGLRARLERFEKGEERIRKAIYDAMLATKQMRLERTLGTLVLQKKPQAVIEFNLGIVPKDYFIEQAPKFDKKRAGIDLKAGVKIPGLGLTESSLTLHIK